MAILKGVLEQKLQDGTWAELHPQTDADLVKYENSTAKAKLDELDERVDTLETGTVESINGLAAKVNIKGDTNLTVAVSGQNINLNSSKLATVVNLGNVDTDLQNHKTNNDNPHNVTKAQVGLGNVDNTSDVNKPISAAQAAKNTALDAEDVRLQSDINTKDTFLKGEVARLDAKDAAQDVTISANYTTLDNKIDAKDAATNNKFDAEVTRLDGQDVTLQTNINNLSADVYHKADIKNIALTGKAEDVTTEPLSGITSTQLQEVLRQINAKSASGTSITTKKLETPTEGYAASYRVLQDAETTGATIDIPFGFKLDSATVIEETDNKKYKLISKAGETTSEVILDLTALATDAKADDLIDTVNGLAESKQNKLTAGEGLEIVEVEGNTVINNTKTAVWGLVGGNITDQTDLQTALTGKVNVEENKSLMSADEHTKLEGIETNAQVNKIESASDDFSIDEDKKLSLNDIAISKITDLQDTLDSKVEKVENKSLVDDTEITKLSGISANAKNVAQSTINGNILIDNVETTVYTEIENTVHDANYKHITVTETSVSDGETTFTKYDDTEVKGLISAEANRATAAEGTLTTNLTNEVTARTEADTALGNRITTIEGDYLKAVDKTELSGLISTEKTRAEGIESGLNTRLETVEGKIPTEASSTNQLADKSFVNSAIATETANFKGTFNLITDLNLPMDATNEQIAAKLLEKIAIVTNNDYAYVIIPQSETATATAKEYRRFKYASLNSSWVYEYTLNNSSFTSEQWAAINSGATAELIGKISTNETAISTETSAREAADTTLSNRVTTIENDYLTSSDKTALEGLITAEKERAEGAEGTLTTNLGNEVTRATAAEDANATAISNHKDDKNNPHEVTKTQVGLGNVDNTSDADKPVSTAQQSALNLKENRVKMNTAEGQPERYKVLSENDFTDVLKSKLDGISANATNVASSTINGNIKIDGTETTVYTEVANTVHDAAYKHINVTETSVTDGETTFNKYVHPTYTTASAEAKKIGRDATGHVVIGEALTKSDVGLSNVDNTSDANKPVSTAQQTALDAKVDKVKMTSDPDRYKVLSENDFTDVLKTKVDGISEGANKVLGSTTNGHITIDGVDTTVYTEVANTVHDANYKHITVTDSSVTDGTNTFNKYVLDSKYNSTVEEANKVKVDKIDAPVSDGSTTFNTGLEGQILTAGENGTVYWKDGYKPGTGVSVTGQYISTTYTTCTIPTTAWTSGETYATASINVAGVKETSNPTLDVLITKENVANRDTINEAWSKVFSAETVDGKINFYAVEVPETELTIQVKGY